MIDRIEPSAGATVHLRATGLACRRGERLLFKGIDLALMPAELLWLRGANGSGKTSLLKILAGLAKPEAGTVEWPLQDRAAVVSQAARAPLFIGHANALKDDLTVAESLHFLLRMNDIDSTPASRLDALQRVGLASRRDAFVRTLSQGQRKRVTLARLALASPRVWLLDEPFDALDAGGIELLEALLTAHVEGGGSAVVTSHRPLGIVSPAPKLLQLGVA